MNKLNCILLIDDNDADNRYHQIIIEEMNVTAKIQMAINGVDALDILNNENMELPELIFLDINMPKMNGWEFLEEFKMFPESKKSKIVIIVLSTSTNPNDINKAKEIAEVGHFETKPLTKKAIENILQKYF